VLMVGVPRGVVYAANGREREGDMRRLSGCGAGGTCRLTEKVSNEV
jgi:hypothetical protein